MADDDIEGEKALHMKVCQERIERIQKEADAWDGCSLVMVLLDHKMPGGPMAMSSLTCDEAGVKFEVEAGMARARRTLTGDELEDTLKTGRLMLEYPGGMCIAAATHALRSVGDSEKVP